MFYLSVFWSCCCVYNADLIRIAVWLSSHPSALCLKRFPSQACVLAVCGASCTCTIASLWRQLHLCSLCGGNCIGVVCGDSCACCLPACSRRTSMHWPASLARPHQCRPGSSGALWGLVAIGSGQVAFMAKTVKTSMVSKGWSWVAQSAPPWPPWRSGRATQSMLGSMDGIPAVAGLRGGATRCSGARMDQGERLRDVCITRATTAGCTT